MTTSTNGINLIKQFEGCRLTAYKPVAAEQYYTIGYGHYGADVTAGMTITQAQADAYLKSDLAKYEKSVNALGLTLTQNQFDALVSFTYNCGAGNLKKLVNNRTLTEIADALLLYNKGSGQVLAGLTKRRKAERELFLKDYVAGNPYREPTTNVKLGSSGNIVKWVQYELNESGSNLTIDGIFGTKTRDAVILFQQDHNLTADGIVGVKTRSALKGE